MRYIRPRISSNITRSGKGCKTLTWTHEEVLHGDGDRTSWLETWKLTVCFKGLTFKELPTNPKTLAQLHPYCWHNLLQLLGVCPPVHPFKFLSIQLPIHLSRIKPALHLYNLQCPATQCCSSSDSWVLVQQQSSSKACSLTPTVASP